MNSQSVFVKPTKGKKVWSKILDIAKHPQGWQLLVNIDGKEKFLDVSEHEYKELGYAPGLLFKQGGSTGIPISFGMVLRLISATPQAAKLFEYKQFFTELFSEDNKLKGGAGDATAPSDTDPIEYALGCTVEAEHSDDPDIASEICLDHLKENPRYYSILKKSGLAPELNDMSASSGLGDPKHVINKPHRQGFDQTPDAGRNIVGKMHSTPTVDGTDGKEHDPKKFVK